MRNREEHGSALATTIGVALVCSVAAYTILFIARAQVGPAELFRERLRARYAAEAGVVWAQAQLWTDPNISFPAGDVDFVFSDARGDINVDVVVPPCGGGGGGGCYGYRREISATVMY